MASRTIAVNWDPLRVAGVPVMSPPPLSVRPPGRVPAVMDHTYGCLPPEASSDAEYATVTVAAGNVLVVIFGLP